MKGIKTLVAIFVIIFATLDLSNAESCMIEKDNQRGECKIMYDCPVLIQQHRETGKRPEICNSKLKTVCCPSNDRISVIKCREYGEYRYKIQEIPHPLPGVSPSSEKILQCNHKITPLIVGGTEAKLMEFPHMALIGFGEKNYEDFRCGGSLISEQWILSAAHCSSSSDPASVAILGHVVRNQLTQNSQNHTIIERLIHSKYNSRYAYNDIALFKLEEPATLNDYVIPICLPDTEVLTTKSAITIGYGQTSALGGVSDTLMKVVIEYMDNNICNEVFTDNLKFSRGRFDSDIMICTGSTNKTGDSCYADSGGALQIYHKGKDLNCMYQITGITCFGLSHCGHPGVPAVYTKVYHYLDWIEENVWPGQ